eukprot:CAMPEP_0172729142 /NCGR_PEP_ID=MMETSP1074-20121228/93873_1 /TAXON_ID=2916 /ORGANISM="Ceratium fusus, Strain PA161109" /LENGTH=87 /DNA_ID=CAMNT_0013556545 /DNA_START=379 /DNA_END=639 /DNA_ORIENTATION=-
MTAKAAAAALLSTLKALMACVGTVEPNARLCESAAPTSCRQPQPLRCCQLGCHPPQVVTIRNWHLHKWPQLLHEEPRKQRQKLALVL